MNTSSTVPKRSGTNDWCHSSLLGEWLGDVRRLAGDDDVRWLAFVKRLPPGRCLAGRERRSIPAPLIPEETEYEHNEQ